MKIGDKFECTIDSVAFGGDGVARIDGMVVFIAFALPGEEVTAKIIKMKSDYLVASIVEIRKKSPDRIVPECPLFYRCPGCAYLHINYSGELALKLEQLESMLRQLENTATPVIAGRVDAGASSFYRNKIVLHVVKDHGDTLLGYVGRNQNELVEVEKCLLAAPQINEELALFRAKQGVEHSLHARMDVTFRYSLSGVMMWRNSPQKGLSWLREQLPFGQISVPVGSFSQVNPEGAAVLVELLQDYLKRSPAETVIDTYSGAGIFGLVAALAGTKNVVMIERDPAAVEAAKFNFKQYGVNGEFVVGDTGETLDGLLENIGDSDVLIVDPPRTGIIPKSIYSIGNSNLSRLVYISCNPSTFVRDAKKLERFGFEAREIKLVNMFPRSAGFELFTVLERKK